MMKIRGKVYLNIFSIYLFLFYSEYLIRINTEAQFAFPMVRVKLIQDSALHVDTNIQGYISLFDKYSLNKFFYLLRLTNLGPDLLVADDTGHLYRISWDGSVHQHLTYIFKYTFLYNFFKF